MTRALGRTEPWTGVVSPAPLLGSGFEILPVLSGDGATASKGIVLLRGTGSGGKGRFGSFHKRRPGGKRSGCFSPSPVSPPRPAVPTGLERGRRLHRAHHPRGAGGRPRKRPGDARRDVGAGRCRSQGPLCSCAGLLSPPSRARSRDPFAQPGTGRGEQEPPASVAEGRAGQGRAGRTAGAREGCSLPAPGLGPHSAACGRGCPDLGASALESPTRSHRGAPVQWVRGG